MARAGGRQLDLFASEEAGAGTRMGNAPRGGAREDDEQAGRLHHNAAAGGGDAVGDMSPFDWVCRHALRVVAERDPALRDLLGYLVALHTLDVESGESRLAVAGSAPPRPLTALPILFET